MPVLTIKNTIMKLTKKQKERALSAFGSICEPNNIKPFAKCPQGFLFIVYGVSGFYIYKRGNRQHNDRIKHGLTPPEYAKQAYIKAIAK